MIDLSSLPPEIREDFRRNFPEECIEEEVEFPLQVSYEAVDIPQPAPIPEPIPIEEPVTEAPENIEEEEAEWEEIVAEEESVEESIYDNPSTEPILFQNNTATITEQIEALETVVEEQIIDTVNENIGINYSRFKGADWFKIVQQQEVILAGLGGIGSYVNFGLSRLGPGLLYLFDDDLFESHNISGQLVSRRDIGKYKVDVTANYARDFSNYSPMIYSQRYTEECLRTKVMICGFDNMKARKVFYTAWKENMISSTITSPSSANEYLFIDGRLLAEEFQIICITGDDIFSQAEYERDFLFSDEEVTEVDCTLKQTSHMAMMIASKMVAYFVNFCNNLSPDNFPRRLPFYTHFNGLMNTYDFKY